MSYPHLGSTESTDFTDIPLDDSNSKSPEWSGTYAKPPTPVHHAHRPPNYGSPNRMFVPFTPPPPPAVSMPSVSPVGQEIRANQDHTWRDFGFAVLFWIHLLAILILTIVGMRMKPTQTSVPFQVADVWQQALVTLILAIFLAAIWLWLICRFAKGLIRFTLYTSAAVPLIIAILFIAYGSLTGFLIFSLLTLISFYYVYLVRSRIPFATVMLVKAVGLVQLHKATIVFAFLGALVMIVWFVVWGFATYAALEHGVSNALLIILVILSLFWTYQVIANVIHVTTAGAIGSWIFDVRGTYLTLGAFKRAITTSFGTICFGSLLVSIVQTIRWLVFQLRTQAMNDNIISQFCLVCIDLVLSCIDAALQYINRYAFVQVALYGKRFIPAAKDTWELFKHSGISALINDDLTWGVLSFAIFTSALVCALVAGIWTHVLYTNDNLTGSMAGMGFALGFAVVGVVMSVVDSAIATLFVAFALDPAAIQRRDPYFYDQMENALSGARSTLPGLGP